MIETNTYYTPKNIMIGQDSYYIALGVVVSGTANAVIKAGEPLKGSLKDRDTAFTAATNGAVGINLHDVTLGSDGKGNATLVIAGCVDTLKLETSVVANITTATTAGEANTSDLSRLIFVEGSAI